MKQIEKAVAIMQNGGVVAFPTDTVYGLGASINYQKAVDRIYEIKQRSRDNPFPLLVSNLSQLKEIAIRIPEMAHILTSHFWPGGLTIIVQKAPALPAYLTNKATVAVRMPNHTVPLKIIDILGSPIIGTSANISGKKSSLTADDVYNQLGNIPDYIIDEGICPGGKESTIVSISESSFNVIRQGLISGDAIQQVLNEYIK
jgi:L-threonylcarbamoyladenylate synthase